MSVSLQGWAYVELQELVSLRTGPFGSSLHKSDYVDVGVPIVNPMHIANGRIAHSIKNCVSAETVQRLRDFKLREGDVVLGRRGEMGRCAVVRDREEGWLCGTGSLIVRPIRDLIRPDFLQLLLSSDGIVEYLKNGAVGSTMANLNQGLLLDMRLLLPPKSEQTRIVAKLEELLSDLEAGVAELKAAQAKLARYRQSLLKAAVDGALTADWRERHTPVETGAQLLARILTERRARWEDKQCARFAAQGKTPPKNWQVKYPEPVAPDTAELPALPAGWVWASVEQLGNVQLGRQRSPGKLLGNNPTPYIRAANITEAGVDLADVLKMDFSDAEKETFALKAGDVLLTEASGSSEHVGRPAIWKYEAGLFCFQNTVLRFSPLGIGSEFAYYMFSALQKLGIFRKVAGGVGINHLSAGKFSKIAVPLPSTAEQERIVQLLAAGFTACDMHAEAIDKSLKQSAAQRKNLLKAAFAGQLVPQDPADEPASVLLERIRAEREKPAKAGRGRGRTPRKTA